MSKTLAKKIVREYVKKLKAHDYSVNAIYLFGSTVRGVTDKWSDIDVAVVTDNLKKDYEKSTLDIEIQRQRVIKAQNKEAERTKKGIQSNNSKIKALESKNEKLNEILIEQESLKDLLYETGKPLEQAVIKALKILGYQAENYDDGILELDQIIISPEKIRFIGECEGKDKKDIDVGKFRQLQDSLNEDFEREGEIGRAHV